MRTSTIALQSESDVITVSNIARLPAHLQFLLWQCLVSVNGLRNPQRRPGTHSNIAAEPLRSYQSQIELSNERSAFYVWLMLHGPYWITCWPFTRLSYSSRVGQPASI